MSHRNHRKLIRKKEEHKEALIQKSIQKKTYVDSFTVEENTKKQERSNLFQDLRTVCDLEMNNYRIRYVALIDVQKFSIGGEKAGFEKRQHPLINYVSEIIRKASCGLTERKEIAHIFQICKKSNIFDSPLNNILAGSSYTPENDLKKEVVIAVNTIINLAKHRFNWVRDLELWKPKGITVEAQLYSLVNHLFAKYYVPDFMNKVWQNENKLYHEWYINIGNGENIRHQKGLPIPLTKKVAHYMMTAPASFSINQAVRWGQVLSMGGDQTIAMGVINTPLGNNFDNDEFWLTVIKFFIDNYPFLETLQYGPIYDYIINQKFINERRVNNDFGYDILPPPQPNFSMKGREPNVLLLNVQRWHNQLARTPVSYGKSQSWNSCGINGYGVKKIIEKIEKRIEQNYIIKELLSSNELWSEGKTMHHCVGSYSSHCCSGHSAIYSMSCESEGTITHLVTMEVNVKEKNIVQARGACNQKPTREDWIVINEWMLKRGISKSKFI